LETSGLIGVDLLNDYDVLFDQPGGQLLLAESDLMEKEMPDAVVRIELGFIMGIPTVGIEVGGRSVRVFVDTGAQLSYMQDEMTIGFPEDGVQSDFYPGFGSFQTMTRRVEIAIGREVFVLRCGQLPPLLGATLLMAGAAGIIGNEIFVGRRVGYFPRRSVMLLQLLGAPE
jgi:hypothetical protein